MAAHSYHLIQSHLTPQGDSLDADRAAVVAAMEAGAPDIRDQVYALAGKFWEPIAVDAWNNEVRSPEVFTTCMKIRDLCRWTVSVDAGPDAARFDIAGSQTVEAMMQHVLGDSDEAVELLRKATDRPTNAYFWESASEKLAKVLITEDRIDEALTVLEAIKAAHPGNTFATNCLEAYAVDTANEEAIGGTLVGFDVDEALPAGMKLSQEQVATFSEQITTSYSADMTSLFTEDLDQPAREAKMAVIQKTFEAAMQRLMEMS